MNGVSRWLLFGATLCLLPGARGQEGCAVSKDLVVRALELVSATPSAGVLGDGILLLKQAEEACDENGDAWYYRSVFERKLGRGNPDYSLGKARERNSPALAAGDNPFQLSTPTRGVAAAPRAPGPVSQGPTLDIRKPDVDQKWALVIGIASFRNPRLNLTYSRKDAESVAELLKSPLYGRFRPDRVRLIADSQATTVNLRAGLNWLARMAGENDLALVYVATHGTARDQDVAGANYIVTYDTDVDSEDGLYSTALPMVEITGAVRTRLRALKVVVLLDTCHSGGAISQTVTLPAAVSPQTLEHIREGTGRVVIAASQVGESSYETPKYGHGLFTYYLLEALKQEKDAPIEKVYEYVNTHVTADATANHWKQHPVFVASDQTADIVIGTPPLSTALLRLAPWVWSEGLAQ